MASPVVLVSTSATGPLPSYFDGCAVLPADAVAQAVGEPFAVVARLGPEGFEAATCSYQAANGAADHVGIDVIVYTKASVVGVSGDFENDAAFVGDRPIEASGAVAVANVGDRAVFGHPAGDQQAGILTARQGDARIVVSVFADAGGGQQRAAAVATRLFQILSQSPPSPDPVPTPGSLALAASSFSFGDGRAVAVSASNANPNTVLTELQGSAVTGRTVYFNGFVPPELDLRDFGLSTHGADRIAVLQFAGPLTLRTTWRDTPVSHTIEVVLRPPQGAGAVDVAIQPDGTGAVIGDPDGQARGVAAAPAVITGNWAALVIPSSLGVGPDWTAQAFVRIEAAAPMPGGASLTGWVLATAPVPVGALTGEQGRQLAMAAPSVLTGSTKGASGANTKLVGPAAVGSASITSVALDATNSHRDLTVMFDQPPALPPDTSTNTGADFLVAVDLAPPGAVGAGPPVTLRWGLSRNATGSVIAPTTATITGQDGRPAGTVPVRLDGTVMHIDLGAATLTPATTPPTTTTTPNAPGAGAPQVTLGGPTQRLRFDVDLTPDQCICPAGPPAGFQAGTPVHDSVAVVVSGMAIALTRQSTATTAVGAIDPLTGEFEASNSTEYWSGRLSSGLDGQYARLPTPNAMIRSSDVSAQAPGGGWGSILDPLNQAAQQSGQGGTSTPSQQPAAPCGPVVTYQVYAGHGVYKTVTQPPPFYLPNPSDGFDQNQFANNLDFGRAVSGSWPPPGCPGAHHFTSRSNLTSSPGYAPSSPLGRDNQSPPTPVTLADFGPNWSVSVSSRVDLLGNHAPIAQVQFSPAIRADRLSQFSTAATQTTTTAQATAIPAGSAAVSPSTTARPNPVPHDSQTTVVVIVVAVVAVFALAAGGFWWRRRTPRQPGQPAKEPDVR